jgi:hypothetical protein
MDTSRTPQPPVPQADAPPNFENESLYILVTQKSMSSKFCWNLYLHYTGINGWLARIEEDSVRTLDADEDEK